MLFSDIRYLDSNLAVQQGWVGVIDSRIAYVGPTAPADPKPYGEVISGAGRFLTPAFYNAHCHAPMVLLRGYAENLPLNEWLFDRIIPFEQKLTAEDIYWGTQLACAEMLSSGIVSFSDMYYHAQESARVVRDSGMKANLSDTLMGSQVLTWEHFPCHIDEIPSLRSWHNSADERIKIDFNVHAEYTCEEEAVKRLVALGRQAQVHMQVHISETQEEHAACKERHQGMTPVQYFDSLGLFELPSTLAHCVYVEDEDLRIIKERGATIALNPASNCKLGSGIAPLGKMLDAGIQLALGTDGPASNNALNFLRDINLLALMYKAAEHNPCLLSPEQVFYIASRGGALSQGRQDCGLIESGLRADLCVWDITSPAFTPGFNLLADLVYAADARDLEMTIVDGKLLYHQGRVLSIELDRARTEVQKRAFALAQSCEDK